jgi:hypothetical protein
MGSLEIISMISWDGRSCKVAPQSQPFGSWLSSCDSLLVPNWVRAVFLLQFFMVGILRSEVTEKETLTEASEEIVYLPEEIVYLPVNLINACAF